MSSKLKLCLPKTPSCPFSSRCSLKTHFKPVSELYHPLFIIKLRSKKDFPFCLDNKKNMIKIINVVGE